MISPWNITLATVTFALLLLFWGAYKSSEFGIDIKKGAKKIVKVAKKMTGGGKDKKKNKNTFEIDLNISSDSPENESAAMEIEADADEEEPEEEQGEEEDEEGG